MVRLGPSDLEVFPVCLRGNVFGWTELDLTADELRDLAETSAQPASSSPA